MPLTTARNTPRRVNQRASYPVAGSATIHAGGLVALLITGGWAVPAGTADSGVAVGVAEETVSGDGSNGANRVSVERGCFQFKNSAGGDEITHLHIGLPAYVVDDETVARTDNSGARAVAGAIADVDASGVWVEVRPGGVGPQGPQGAPA
jgi:hypothetical protein